MWSYIYVYIITFVILSGFSAFIVQQREVERWRVKRELREWFERLYRELHPDLYQKEERIYQMLKELYYRELERLIIEDSLEKMF